ncbi:potassium-transporting ATPase subunit KdpA [Clostridium sp.]|uniref:potassium-transporting ATPase subunit KdpA n=1 Tax=Clostridium sp. TaxID=1506 RepID=UPI002FCAE3D3
MLQVLLTFLIFAILVVPMGKYLYKVASGEKSIVDKVFNPIDNAIYKVCKINRAGMNFKHYLVALITTNVVMMLVGFIVLSIQGFAPLNPNNAGAMDLSLAFNTIVSFMTNTNLQHYAGETSLSYLSQMMVITFMMFASAATGYAACMAFIRGIVGKDKNLGNFYVDIVRITTRMLIPLAFVVSLALVSQGVPQTFEPTKTVTTIEGMKQDIPLGPVASLESIKHIGTNGGGFFGANSSMPFENPTGVSNIIEILCMMILPASCVIAFGYMVASKRKLEDKPTNEGLKQARTIFIAMAVLFVVGLGVLIYAESQGSLGIAKEGLKQTLGNMEGKEMRFGVMGSSLFTSVTTAFTTGSVNNMHDSLTPLGGLIPMLNMMLNVVFGGKGVGFMNMIMYVILTVFICGLMIGRTPEYLGKKVESREMKLVSMAIIIHPLIVLSLTALAVTTVAGMSGVTNPGNHGLSQVLYEYASSAANNGSGFEGLADNTVFWNITTAIAMLLGRYLPIILQLTIAGSLLSKNPINESMGTLKTSNMTFTVILIIIVIVFAALTFMPSLALGPIAEHLKLAF